MPFVKLELRPGVFRDGTRYGAEGTWYDCDKVRFRKGFPEKIGGWEKYVSSSYKGSARKLHDWGTIDGSRYVGVGTHLKQYVQEGNSYYDITPVRSSVTLGTNPFTTGAATGVITVAHTSHGALVGAYVTFSGATGPFDGVPAADVNQEHRIQTIIDDDSYRIVVDTAATTGSVAGGGSAVVASYAMNPGLDTYVAGSGWGAGEWGVVGWGGSTSLGAFNQLRLWSMDNFGDDLVANVRQGDITYWDQSNGTNTAAKYLHELTRRTVTLTTDPLGLDGTTTVTLTDIGGHGAGPGDTVTLSGAVISVDATLVAGEINASHTIVATPTDTTFTIVVSTAATGSSPDGGSAIVATYEAGEYYTPTAALQVLTSPVARHIIAFGTTDVGSTILDPMLVRWCTSENAAEWEPRDENSAGGQRLSAGSAIVGSIRTRQEIVIWTDVGMTSMRYTGSNLATFSFSQVAGNVSMISPNAAINANGVVFFMDRGGFYTYTGAVRRLVCPIRDYVFSDIDFGQANKVFASTNVDLSEIYWFYPSASGAGEIDRYVVYNYDENLWTFGTMIRGHWSDAPTKIYPLASTINRSDLGTDPIATTNTSSTITITENGHGMVTGDTVIMDGATAVGGLTTSVLNHEYPVTVVDVNSYTITLPDDATSSTTGGGSAISVVKPNYLYSHEVGHDADGVAMTAYIESADMDIEDGYNFWFARRVLPDVEFRDSAVSTDTVTLDVYGHDYPHGPRTRRTTSDVHPATQENFIRLRARQISLRAESSGAGYGWRLGYVRLEARKDGRQ